MTSITGIRKAGLYPRLFLAFLLVALLPVAASYLIHVTETKKDALALAHDLLEQVATVQQRRLDLELKNLNDQLGLIASRTQMRRSLDQLSTTSDPAERAMVERILQDLIDASSDILGVWLRHVDGLTVVGVPAAVPDIPDWQIGDPAMRFHWEDGTARSAWLSGPLTLDDRHIGSIHVLSKLDRLRDMLDDFPEVANGGRSLLILQDPDGLLRPVSGTTQHDLDRIWPETLLREQAAIASASPTLSAPVAINQELDVIYTYRALGEHGNGALTYMRLEQLEAALARQRAGLAWDVLIVLALSILMAAFFARMISQPIKDLTRSTERIRKGDLGARVTPRHWGEFALLTDSFNVTAATLQRHTEALREEIRTRRRAQRELVSIANSDALTGLCNRRYLLEALGHRIKECEAGKSSGTLIFIDLDGFKPVNDRYGHDAGDMTLRTVANRLINLVRGQDCVARFGGDEFVILLGDPASSEDTESIAERINQSLQEPIVYKTFTIEVGGSIGIAPIEAGMTAEQVIALADNRMYQTKASKRAAPG